MKRPSSLFVNKMTRRLKPKVGKIIRRQKFALRRVQAILSGQREMMPEHTEHYGIPRRHVFFGYYDLTPFDEANERILAHSAHDHNRPPAQGENIEVGFFHRGISDQFQKIGESSAWSRQQGCRLQWYPRTSNGKNDLVLYNIETSDGLRAIVKNTRTLSEEAFLPHALYDVAPDGSFGISLDFYQLHVHRSHYGYLGPTQGNKTNNSLLKTANLFRTDIRTGNIEPLIMLSDIANIDPDPTMQGALHHLDHISISPDGSRFLFFHTWHFDKKKSTRVYISDSNGTNVRPLGIGNHVSHYAWIDNTTILAYAWNADCNGRYWGIDLESGERTEVDDEMLREDGHPSILNGGMAIITDTYPDPHGYQSLLLHDCKSKHTRLVGRFYSPFAFRGEDRCDLHPRLSPDGNFVCVDSARCGSRSLYVFPTMTC